MNVVRLYSSCNTICYFYAGRGSSNDNRISITAAYQNESRFIFCTQPDDQEFKAYLWLTNEWASYVSLNFSAHMRSTYLLEGISFPENMIRTYIANTKNSVVLRESTRAVFHSSYFNFFTSFIQNIVHCWDILFFYCFWICAYGVHCTEIVKRRVITNCTVPHAIMYRCVNTEPRLALKSFTPISTSSLLQTCAVLMWLLVQLFNKFTVTMFNSHGSNLHLHCIH